MKYKDVILFSVFWSFFIISFILFGLITVVSVFIGISTFLFVSITMFIVFTAFIYSSFCIQILNGKKDKPSVEINRKIYYKPIKLPEPPTPPKKRKKRK